MATVQKWLALIAGLSALTIVVTNPQGVASALNAGQKFVSGTTRTAMGR